MEYNKLASEESVLNTAANLKGKGYNVIIVKNKFEAMAEIKALIPAGASVMNGNSITLDQIGFIDYLKGGAHGWNNLHEAIVKETDKTKQSALRKQALLSEYYLGSLHGLAEDGQFVIGSNTGSQLPHVVYSSKNLIFVVSTKKIVPNLSEALNRLEEYVYPLEQERTEKAYGSRSVLNKIVIFKGDSPTIRRRINLILVKENLGF